MPTSPTVFLALLCACLTAAAQPARTATPPVLEEVPFITTPDDVTVAMLELAGVGPHDHVIDLGSGDGRIVITAARRFGARGLGVEIVPDLVARSRVHAQLAGVTDRATFRTQDLFETDLAPATVVTMYLLPEVNLALRPRLLALAPGTRIVSHDWDLGDWRPDRTLTLAVPQKAIGLEKISRVHLWTVPARLQGLWCGAGGMALNITQQFQAVAMELVQGRDHHGYTGRIDGRALRAWGAAGAGFTARADGDVLRITWTSQTEPVAGLAGHDFRRAEAAACPAGAPTNRPGYSGLMVDGVLALAQLAMAA